MKWTSLGSDIWQQPQVLAPLNLNPELFLKLAFPLEPETSLALTWAGLALSEGHWHTLTLLPTPGLREEHLFPPRGKDWCGFAELFMSCWILLQGKGEGENLLPSYFFVTNSKSWSTFVLHLPRVLLLFSFTCPWGPWLAAGQATSLLLVVVSNSLGWAGQTLS